MRVFVYEHLCSGALAGQPGADSLRREGLAMLASVLADLADCPDVQPVALVEPDLLDALPQGEIHAVGRDPVQDHFRRLAQSADFTLVIAPEFDDILESRCRWAVAADSRLLGPTPDAVRLTADKLLLAAHLIQHGVATPPTARLRQGVKPGFSDPVVCKHRFGAGSQFTALIHNGSECVAYFNRVRDAGGPIDQIIVQPFAPGLAVSIAFLAGPGRLVALPAVEQRLSADSRFEYLGGRLPLAPHLDERASRLAERAFHAVPGLAGYFGVDLVLGASADGRDDVVIEINPRLTTSYVGLRNLARGNLMQALLAVACGETARQEPRPLVLEWRTDEVVFHADGRLD